MNLQIAFTQRSFFIRTFWTLALCWSAWIGRSETPKVGEAAPDFTLQTLDGAPVHLNSLASTERVVLVVLRGWPGYQCPLCTQQVHDLVSGAAELRQRNVKMLFVYPGPAEALQTHASEFLQNKDWPKDFLFVMDPDYSMVNAYDLRWNEKNETAYPSTFVIAPGNKIRFAKISKEHGGRVKLRELLKVLDSSM